MIIEGRIISIQIDIEEWDKIRKDIDQLRYGKVEYNYKTCPNLEEFIDSINTISNNRNMKISKKL